MKAIKQYIFEQLLDVKIKDLKVVYNVEPESIIFQVPVGYSESDFQIYMGDKFLPYLPGDEKISKERFGINFNNIYDAYFEYKSFEALDEQTQEYDIEWDSSFDTQQKAPEFFYVKITGLRYIILFDVFNIKKNEGDNIDYLINKIFSASESSKVNEYPITIKFNKKETEYKEI